MKKELALEYPWGLESIQKSIYRKTESAARLRDNISAGNGNPRKLADCIGKISELSKYLITGCRKKGFYSKMDFVSNLPSYSGLLGYLQSFGRDFCSEGLPPEVTKAAKELCELTTDWEDKAPPELPEQEAGAKPQPEPYVEVPKPESLHKKHKRKRSPNRVSIKRAVLESKGNYFNEPGPRMQKAVAPAPGPEPVSLESPPLAYEIPGGRKKDYLNKRCEDLDGLVSKVGKCDFNSNKIPYGLKTYVSGICELVSDMFVYIQRKGGDDTYKLLDFFRASVSSACKALKPVYNRFPEEFNREIVQLKTLGEQWNKHYLLHKPITRDASAEQPF